MRKLTRRTFLAGGTAAAIVAAGQWGRTGKAIAQTRTAQAGGVLNLYTSRHYDTDDSLYQNFTDLTGVRVNMIEAGADELIERIKTEGANSPADILMTVDAGRLWRAQQEDLFEPIQSSVLDSAIPDNLRDPAGHWYGFTTRARVIMYHRDRVNPNDISTYQDLADPQWRGKLLIRTSSNIYNLSLTGALIHHLGEEATEEWARGIAANLARTPTGGDTDQIRALAAGEGDLAVANTYYLARLMRSEDPADRAVAAQVGVIFPNQDSFGTHVNISGAGVLRNSPNRQAAIQYLEYLAGLEAQAIFAEGNNEYPVVEGAEITPELESFGTFQADTLNASIFARNNQAALQLMDRAGWR